MWGILVIFFRKQAFKKQIRNKLRKKIFLSFKKKGKIASSRINQALTDASVVLNDEIHQRVRKFKIQTREVAWHFR